MKKQKTYSYKKFQTLTNSEKYILAKQSVPIVWDLCVGQGWSLYVSYRMASDQLDIAPVVIGMLCNQQSNFCEVIKASKQAGLKITIDMYDDLIIYKGEQ